MTNPPYISNWALSSIPYERRSEDEKNDVINASALPFVLQCALMAGAAWLYGRAAHLNYVVWMMLFGISQGATTYLGFIARGLDRNVDFALSGVICSVINLTLNVVLITAFGLGFIARCTSVMWPGRWLRRCIWLTGSGFSGVFGGGNPLPTAGWTSELLRFSLPLCFKYR